MAATLLAKLGANLVQSSSPIPQDSTFMKYKQELKLLSAELEKIHNEFRIFCEKTSKAATISVNLCRNANKFYSLCNDETRSSYLRFVIQYVLYMNYIQK